MPAADNSSATSARAASLDGPLAWGQILVIALIRFCDPLAMFVVLPILPQFLVDIGVAGDIKRAGYVAGLAESAFSAAQALTLLVRGRASDRFGRKPVLYVGLLGQVASLTAMGCVAMT